MPTIFPVTTVTQARRGSWAKSLLVWAWLQRAETSCRSDPSHQGRKSWEGLGCDAVFHLVDRNPTCWRVSSLESPCVEMSVRLLNFR